MLDIRALCRDHSIPIIESGHHHSHRGWVQLHCPFCGMGREGWHLGFSLHKGNFNCWRCGGHRVWDVLTRLLGGEAAAKRAWGTYRHSQTSHPSPPQPKPIARRKTIWEPPRREPLSTPHQRYLLSRHFNPNKLESQWELSGTRHLSGEWSWRILFPLYDISGRLLAYGGRAINDETKPKYKMPHNENLPVEPQSLLYGIHLVDSTAVIVEGPTDVWRMGPGAVASLGVDWSIQQAKILSDIPRRFILFDPDRAGRKRARQLARWLSVYNGDTEIISGIDCDPGDLPQDEADDIMKELLNGS